MANWGASTAKNAANTAANTAAGFGSEASSIGSMLIPELTREATHPTGYNPNDLNAMLVAGAEGAGGAAGGLMGETGLRAARSRNTGATSGVMDEIARSRTRALSSNALGVQGMNAQEKERQRQAGLTGLEGVRGGDIKANLEAQGLVPEDIKMWKANQGRGFFQGMLDLISAGSKGAQNVMTGMAA